VDRRKKGSKHHLAVDAAGTPLAAEVTAANVNDVTRLIPLVDAIPPVKGKPGAPLRKPEEVMGDRAYHDAKRRMILSGRGIAPVIARRGDPHGSGFGVLRYVVEQTIALLHQFRRLRTRFDKRDDIHQVFLTIGCAMICWRRLHRLTG
jgi:transposase